MVKGGLYIHIPFCKRKCDYCDFYSTVSNSNQFDKFAAAEIDEINLYQKHPVFSALNFNTLYFGGGTPSLFSPDLIQYIFQTAVSTYNFSPTREISLEANPESLTLEKLLNYRKIGFNRISIGVQSFSDKSLRKLGRLHDVQQAVNSVRWARQAGFGNISIDLIFAIPGQTFQQWEQTLSEAISLNPHHISAYCMTIESGTPLAKKINSGAETAASEDLEREMYLATVHILDHAGFKQYEISNFAKSGFECKHNLTYWDISPYLGIGPSAHSFLGDSRQWNVSDLNSYLKKLDKHEPPIAGTEKLTEKQKEFEFIFLHLRTTQGLNLLQYEQLFQKSFEKTYRQILEKLDAYPGKNLFEISAGHFRLTPEGLVLFDELCSYFA